MPVFDVSIIFKEIHWKEYAEFDNSSHSEPSSELSGRCRRGLTEPLPMIVMIKYRADIFYFFISLTYSSYSTSPSSALVLISIA